MENVIFNAVKLQGFLCAIWYTAIVNLFLLPHTAISHQHAIHLAVQTLVSFVSFFKDIWSDVEVGEQNQHDDHVIDKNVLSPKWEVTAWVQWVQWMG